MLLAHSMLKLGLNRRCEQCRIITSGQKPLTYFSEQRVKRCDSLTFLGIVKKKSIGIKLTQYRIRRSQNCYNSFDFHPPPLSKTSPIVFPTYNTLSSIYLGPTSVNPIGISFSPAKPGMFKQGTCRMVHIEQKDCCFSYISSQLKHA